jgi:hypothetical protein
MRRVFYVVVFIAFSSFHVGEAAESSSCQTLVFSGLSTSCNLNGGQSSSEDACCRALDTANAKRCFCDEGLMTTIKLVIGDNGIQFFRDFAIGSCSGELTEGEACVDGDGDDESEWDGVIAPPPPMDHTHRDSELSEIDYYTRDVRGSPPPDRRPTPLFPTRAPPERETIANFILDPRRGTPCSSVSASRRRNCSPTRIGWRTRFDTTPSAASRTPQTLASELHF